MRRATPPSHCDTLASYTIKALSLAILGKRTGVLDGTLNKVWLSSRHVSLVPFPPVLARTTSGMNE